ncbi:MAG: endonuclease/exonuclease/phosphatase family protein [Acidimicrobiia bacterium]|jgi:endonuclease/exonuclease/phosphatase family metal-dependent hydrolase
MLRRALVVLALAAAVAVAGDTTVMIPAGAAPAAGAAAPSPGDGLRVVNFNVLHGTFCDDTASCQAPDRVDLLLRQLEAARCPEVVGLQEVNPNLRALFATRLPQVCGGRYRGVFTEPTGNDTELVLTTLPARKATVVPLPGGLRSASRVELTSALGPVVLVVTHQDGDKTFPSCRSDIERYRCPKPCPEGTTFSACQTILGQRLAEGGGPKRALRIYMGDFNLPAGTPRYAALVGDGWVDTHLAAGNPECDPATGVQCTSGRDDKSIAVLKDPAARETERIDFIFVKAPRCAARFDPVTDADGDGTGTGLFAATPALNGPGGLAWPSDHTAVSMDVSCA